MAKLDVYKILVKDEQDWEPGGDELYFMVDGTTKVGPTPGLSTGQSHVFPLDPIPFSGTVSVSLFEDDPWINNDDFLGTATIDDTPGQEKWTFSGHGGVYDVWFNILA